MAKWSAPAPVNPEREHWLHDQSKLPTGPERTRRDLVIWALPFVLGIVFTGVLVALAFEVRSSWESHRDWVVPVTAPLLVLGGVASAYLVQRRAIAALGPAVVFLLLTCGFVALNAWRATETDGGDGLRDALSILGGVSLGLTVASLVAGMVWVESTRPTRAPAPEL